MTQHLRPPIIISSLDALRIEKLLDSLDQDQFSNIEELQAELDRADIVNPESIPSDIVTMNSIVQFRVDSSDRIFSLKLVYPRDADGGNSMISILAPVGSALLGLREGDQISWPKPGGGFLSVHIMEVTYQPERSGDLHL